MSSDMISEIVCLRCVDIALLSTQTSLQKPSKLQKDTLPLLLKDQDVIVESPAKSGKTTTACISVLQKVDVSNLQCQALILTPSHGTTMDALEIVSALGSHSIRCHVNSDQEHISEKSIHDKGSHIILGTPSCVQEIIGHGFLMTSSIRVIVLDRLDKMISKGSSDAIENILQVIPKSAQVVILLSETFTKLGDLASKLGDLTTKSMRHPSWIRHEEPEVRRHTEWNESTMLTILNHNLISCSLQIPSFDQ
jgi:superfamily II DNA/RNA helicase